MDKAILKKFAIESRQDLMQRMENKIKTFYIDEEFSKQQSGDIYILANGKHSLNLSKEEYNKRELLIKRINELGLDQVIEEAAYTWFNRIVAIRYMEIHNYLPLTKNNQSLGIRVLSSKDNTPDPEIMKFTNLVNFELDIDFKKEKYVELKDDNEKFKYVLLLVCKKLGKVIPQVFDGVTDYIDILVPDNLLNESGFVNKIITEVPVENYDQVEIIGWLYQYYNQTEKDRVISEKKAYKKNEIAYATQLFTPDWIVKYMVENSLGKYWIEHGGNINLIKNWKYFIKENLNFEEKKLTVAQVNKMTVKDLNDTLVKKLNKLDPKDIKCIDPCCGSGHILVYMFEVLFQIYESYGYSKKDIAKLIVKNNLYGLDIDDRAGQLSVLSVLLKAREYDKEIFDKDIIKKLNVMSIQESNLIELKDLQLIKSNYENVEESSLNDTIEYVYNKLKDAKEIGSLIKLENKNYEQIINKIIKLNNSQLNIFEFRELNEINTKFLVLVYIAKILSQKYDIVITNPPYMRLSRANSILKRYLSSKYPLTKYDVYSAFIEKSVSMLNESGIASMITPQAWMFLTTFEKLRNSIIKEYHIDDVMQLGNKAFECGFGTATFVIKNEKLDNQSTFIKLDNYESENKKIAQFRNKSNYYNVYVKQFLKLPAAAFAYWASDNIMTMFDYGRMDKYEMESGIVTGNNEKYLRYWYEIESTKMCCKKIDIDSLSNGKYKWFKCNKGGGYRKWYGNMDYVVNLQFCARDIKQSISPEIYRLRNFENYSREAITWPLIGDKKFSAKLLPQEVVNNKAANSLYTNNSDYKIMGYMNSCVFNYLINMINPTVSYPIIDILSVPECNIDIPDLNDIVIKNIEISKEDWDSFETSWDFKRHPLLKSESKVSTIRETLANLNNYIYKQRRLLKYNEEKLNKIYIDIYGLRDELSAEVEEKDITIRKVDKLREIKSLISYAVGCMLGRYSLDEVALIYAGGEFDESRYKKFKADPDNIIPITDEAYFDDDIVQRFKQFIEVSFGKETLNENLDFIAETLGKKGTETSEETIRRYFVNDFFNDHCKIYQKRPIYWLLDSGKKNGFKALIYMHRYNENLIPKARLDYLHRIQTTYEKLLSDVNYKLTTDLSMIDKKETQKRQADLNAKLQEIKEYDERIAHIANQRISIDLDDGVKVNYEKFKDILAKIK